MKSAIETTVVALSLCLLGPLSFELGSGEWIIPITLQSLVVIVMAAVFGALPGVLGVGIYLLVGGLGLPVFAGYNSGWQSFVSPSGGFLIGFLFTAWLAGWGYQQLSARSAIWLLPMFIGCQLILLMQGAVGLSVAGISPQQIGSIMLSLLPGLLVKAALAVLLTLGLRAVLRDDKLRAAG